MAHADLKLYTRGFFGSKAMATEAQQRPKRSRPVLSVFDLSQEEVEHTVVNESVVEIYNQLIRRQVIPTDFDFRERVLKVALASFGTPNLAAWAIATKASPTFTQTHADFIEDTLRFIETGKRSMTIDIWEKIVEPGSNDPMVKIEYNDDLIRSQLTAYSKFSGRETHISLPNSIANWVRQPGGFTDLIYSLYIFFGYTSTQ